MGERVAERFSHSLLAGIETAKAALNEATKDYWKNIKLPCQRFAPSLLGNRESIRHQERLRSILDWQEVVRTPQRERVGDSHGSIERRKNHRPKRHCTKQALHHPNRMKPMKRYVENLESWRLYAAAEKLLGEYIAEQCAGTYQPQHRKVFHDRKITKIAQERIKGFAEALSRTDHGAP
jgi:hypothetical protein